MKRRLQRLRRLVRLRERLADGARLSLAHAVAERHRGTRAHDAAERHVDALPHVAGDAQAAVWKARRAAGDRGLRGLQVARRNLEALEAARRLRQDEMIVAMRERDKLARLEQRIGRVYIQEQERHRQKEEEEIYRMATLAERLERRRRGETER